VNPDTESQWNRKQNATSEEALYPFHCRSRGSDRRSAWVFLPARFGLFKRDPFVRANKISIGSSSRRVVEIVDFVHERFVFEEELFFFRESRYGTGR
jgi:hypothetical protein